MFFSKIKGLWTEGSYLFLKGEYRNIKFHINEIQSLQIVDETNTLRYDDDLPIRKAKIQFLLKSGRKKTCYVRKLTKRKYTWLLNLIKEEEHDNKYTRYNTSVHNSTIC